MEPHSSPLRTPDSNNSAAALWTIDTMKLLVPKQIGEIDDEIRFQVAHGNLVSVHDELAPAENPRTRGDKSCAKLHEHVQQVEEIGERTEEGDGDAQTGVVAHASGAADVREVEVEGVDEESDEAGDEEDVVPQGDDLAVGIEDLVAPWNVELIGDGVRRSPEVAEVRRWPAEYSIHLPLRIPMGFGFRDD
ncbi:hypothetical protein U1Q18_038389 [Sarracenia purpurea var. burkii]